MQSWYPKFTTIGCWKDWKGSDAMPVHADSVVEIEMRAGIKTKARAGDLRWSNIGKKGDIIAYRETGRFQQEEK